MYINIFFHIFLVTAKVRHTSISPVDVVSALTNFGTGTSIIAGAGVSNVGAIKVANACIGGGGGSGVIGLSSSINATQLTLSTSPVSTSGANSIRGTFGSGGQSTQLRVVMANLMASSMIKPLESSNPGRTQITAFTAASTRSVGSSTPITVTRSIAQTTFLPRTSNVTSNVTPIGGIGVGCVTGLVSTAQRLFTPIRSTTTSGMSTTRGTAISRNCPSPSATVISQTSNTPWMATNTSGQVQFIRAIQHQHRQRTNSCLVTVSGTVVQTTTTNPLQSNAAIISTSNHQSVSSSITPCCKYSTIISK